MGYYANTITADIKIPKERISAVEKQIREKFPAYENEEGEIIEKFLDDFSYGHHKDDDRNIFITYWSGKWYDGIAEVFSKNAEGEAFFVGEDSETWAYKYELDKISDALELNLSVTLSNEVKLTQDELTQVIELLNILDEKVDFGMGLEETIKLTKLFNTVKERDGE